MVKVSSGDALHILRKYKIAGDENVPRQVERLKFANPSEHNTVVSFIFLGRKYHVLFDDTAEDQVSYIESEIAKAQQGAIGALVENPLESTFTYGMPYHGKDVYLFTEVSATTRLDAELARRYPDISRSAWQKYIKAGRVSINGEQIASPKHPVKGEEKIDITWPESQDFSDKELPIIYEDDDVIVINKPVGVLTHAASIVNDEFTVAEFMRSRSTHTEDTERVGIVHRLDRDTSGIMICAKNPQSAEILKKQFANRTVKKEYRALVSSAPKQDEAIIDLPISRNPKAPSTFRVDVNGKTAQTKYTVIDATDKVSILKVEPKTGRTHQIRVHLAHIGSPIIGDRVYGGKPAERLYLHAHSLTITLPSGEARTFSAPIPEEFSETHV